MILILRAWDKGTQGKNAAAEKEQIEDIRKWVIEACALVLGEAARVSNEALFISTDLPKLSPVPDLFDVGLILLAIWDSAKVVGVNRTQNLRLVRRCAEMLVSMGREIQLAGIGVDDGELQNPVRDLQTAFQEIHGVLREQTRRSVIYLYLKRDQIHRSIERCDLSLESAFKMFNMKIQIVTLRLVQTHQLRSQLDRDLILRLLGLKPLFTDDTASASPDTQLFTASNTNRADQDGDDR